MARDVWITGIGIASSLGEGLDAHWRAMAEAETPAVNVDLAFTPPYGIHPMVALDLDTQIPKKSDQRQMEPWQRLGTYSAGLALSDAGIAGNLDVLAHTHAVVAADGGERDIAVDTTILEGLKAADPKAPYLNERLSNDLRPTLFLAQLPNLVAGNISIVHKVTGSSRTFMGEEIAGVSATEIAWRRIGAGQGDIFLVGGAVTAERKDSVLNCALGGVLWAGDHLPVWERLAKGGGAMLGSVGAFLVLEAREHAEARGRTPYAKLLAVATDQSRRRPGDVAAKLTRQFDALLPPEAAPAAVLSSATGVAPASEEERDVLAGLINAGRVSTVRATGSWLGSSTSAAFPAAAGLAALAVSRRGFYRPFDPTGFETVADVPDRIAISTVGTWRGEGSALIAAVD